jgi:hypothetical protein
MVDWREQGTGLSGVHQTVWVAIGPNGWLLQTPMVGWRGKHRTVSGVHRTIRFACRQKAAASCPTTIWGVGAYKYHPNRPLQGVGAQETYQGI